MLAIADAWSSALGVLVEFGVVLLLGAGYFVWWLWKNKRMAAPMKRAIEAEDTAAFDAALRKHFKAMCHKDNDAFIEVFAWLLGHNSLACARVLFAHADGPTWQQIYLAQTADSLNGPLEATITYGSPEMLRLLLEHGMQPQAEPRSPWLLAVASGAPDMARVLDAVAPTPMTPELQHELDEELLHEDAWETHPEAFVAVIDYLSEIHYPIPAAVGLAAEQLKKLQH